MINRDIVIEYLNHFCEGNIDGVESTLDPKFTLKGPLFEFDSRDAYISSLREDPPELAAFELIDVTESENSVSVYYTYKKRSGPITMAQLFKLRDGKISKILLVFDSADVA